MNWREIVVVILTGFVVKLMFIREIAERCTLNTGKGTFWELDIDVSLGPFFAREVTAMRAIDDAVVWKPEIIH